MFTKKENYLMFKDTGVKNKEKCKQYYLQKFKQCKNLSGGVDVQGGCWSHIWPNLVACDFVNY